MRLHHWLLALCGLFFVSVLPATAQEELAQECLDAQILTFEECQIYLQNLYGAPAEQPTYEEPVAEEPTYEEPAPTQPQLAQECIDAGIVTEEDCNAYLQSLYAEPVAEEPAYEEPAPEQPQLAQECIDAGIVTEEDCNAYLQSLSETPAEEPVAEEPAPDQPQLAQECIDAGIVTEEDCNTYLQSLAETPVEEPVAEEPAPEQPQLAQECIDAAILTEEECNTYLQTLAETPKPEDVVSSGTEEFIEPEVVDPYASTEVQDLQAVTEPLPEGYSEAEAAPLFDSGKEGEPEEIPSDAQPTELPTSDEDARVSVDLTPAEMVEASNQDIQALDSAPEIMAPQDVTIINQEFNTYIYEVNNTYIINNSYDDRDRIFGSDANYQFDQIGDNRFRETVYRDDGSVVVTVRDQYGNILERYRTDPYGAVYVFAYFDYGYYDDMQYWGDPGYDLPPLYINISMRDYVMDWYYYDANDISLFFQLPPVEKVRRLYSIDEVKRSARLRDSVRRLEVGNLNFASGSAQLSRSQIDGLEKLANAMLTLLDNNPAETFLIEGHTDAPGSDQANLRLSDQRASTIARILTQYYGVPPENLATQGYGERFLKVHTKQAEPRNRRVVVRRITPLISPYFASN